MTLGDRAKLTTWVRSFAENRAGARAKRVKRSLFALAARVLSCPPMIALNNFGRDDDGEPLSPEERALLEKLHSCDDI